MKRFRCPFDPFDQVAKVEWICEGPGAGKGEMMKREEVVTCHISPMTND